MMSQFIFLRVPLARPCNCEYGFLRLRTCPARVLHVNQNFIAKDRVGLVLGNTMRRPDLQKHQMVFWGVASFLQGDRMLRVVYAGSCFNASRAKRKSSVVPVSYNFKLLADARYLALYAPHYTLPATNKTIRKADSTDA